MTTSPNPSSGEIAAVLAAEDETGWQDCPTCGGHGMVMSWGGPTDCDCYRGQVELPPVGPLLLEVTSRG